MNERIKTMWEEATGSVWPCHGKLTAGESGDNLKKFAELIIKECIDLVEYNSHGAAKDIKEHFGVME